MRRSMFTYSFLRSVVRNNIDKIPSDLHNLIYLPAFGCIQLRYMSRWSNLLKETITGWLTKLRYFIQPCDLSPYFKSRH